MKFGGSQVVPLKRGWIGCRSINWLKNQHLSIDFYTLFNQDDGTKREIKSNPGLRIATESALKTGKPLPITTIRSPNSIRRSESAKTTIDRKQFQQDTKRYTEILANLKKSALARDANKNCTLAQSPISTTTSLRKLIPSASSHELSSLVTLNGPSHSPIQVEPKTNRMRHITSTRDLASMTDNA